MSSRPFMYSIDVCCYCLIPRKSRPGPTAAHTVLQARPLSSSAFFNREGSTCEGFSIAISMASNPQSFTFCISLKLLLVKGDSKRNEFSPYVILIPKDNRKKYSIAVSPSVLLHALSLHP